MTHEINDLIQGHVDGANTPEDEGRLRSACDSDPLVAAELDSAIGVGRILDTITAVRPSEAFAPNVMASLPEHPSWEHSSREHSSRERAPAPSRTTIFSWPTKPVFTLAYGLVAGVVVTAAVMMTLGVPLTDNVASGGTSATMAPMSKVLISESFDVGDSQAIHIKAEEIEQGITIVLEGNISSDMIIALSIDQDGSTILDSSFSPDSD